MYKKLAPFLVILLLLFVVTKRSCQERQEQSTIPKDRQTDLQPATGLNRNVAQLEYTRHALCRMDCRQVSENDVQEILLEGTINQQRSDINDDPCPTYALEGYTADREHLRVVFAQCSNSTRVVTCINLDEDFACHCPGDKPKRRTER